MLLGIPYIQKCQDIVVYGCKVHVSQKEKVIIFSLSSEKSLQEKWLNKIP